MGVFQSTIQKQLVAVLGDDTLYAFPSLPFYQQDHVKRYNLDLSTKPVAVTYPKTTAQVSAIVKIAAAAGLKVQPKSGGHSYANYSSPDGGIIVDLKNFQQFSMDTTTWFATVGAGTLLGELDKRLIKFNRAVAHGTCPQVGLGGHATIGGLGPASRLFGAALDHIEEVEVVTADGSIVRASNTQNQDLFWALRGAGASFGIITEFILHTHEAPGELIHFTSSFTLGHCSWDDMAEAFKMWQRFVSQKDLTWRFASTVTIFAAGLSIDATFFGSQEEFDELVKMPDFPITARIKNTSVFRDWLGVLEHWWLQVAINIGGGIPAHSYTKTLTFGGCHFIPDTVIDEMFKYISETPKQTHVWFIIFDLAGGQVNAVAQDATAYAHRDALFYLQAYAISLSGKVAEKTKDFLRGLDGLIKNAMHKAGEEIDFGAYAGYVDPELVNGQQEYWRDNLPRLEKIKATYDPQDVFHNLQSVRPDGKEVSATLVPGESQKKSSSWYSIFTGCFNSSADTAKHRHSTASSSTGQSRENSVLK